MRKHFSLVFREKSGRASGRFFIHIFPIFGIAFPIVELSHSLRENFDTKIAAYFVLAAFILTAVSILWKQIARIVSKLNFNKNFYIISSLGSGNLAAEIAKQLESEGAIVKITMQKEPTAVYGKYGIKNFVDDSAIFNSDKVILVQEEISEVEKSGILSSTNFKLANANNIPIAMVSRNFENIEDSSNVEMIEWSDQSNHDLETKKLLDI